MYVEGKGGIRAAPVGNCTASGEIVQIVNSLSTGSSQGKLWKTQLERSSMKYQALAYEIRIISQAIVLVFYGYCKRKKKKNSSPAVLGTW